MIIATQYRITQAGRKKIMLETKNISITVRRPVFRVGYCYKPLGTYPGGLDKYPEGICVAIREGYPQGCLFNPQWQGHDGTCFMSDATAGCALPMPLGHYWYGIDEVHTIATSCTDVIVDAGAGVVECSSVPEICAAGKTVILGRRGESNDVLLFNPFWTGGHDGSEDGVPGFPRSHYWVDTRFIVLADSKVYTERKMKP